MSAGSTHPGTGQGGACGASDTLSWAGVGVCLPQEACGDCSGPREDVAVRGSPGPGRLASPTALCTDAQQGLHTQAPFMHPGHRPQLQVQRLPANLQTTMTAAWEGSVAIAKAGLASPEA